MHHFRYISDTVHYLAQGHVMWAEEAGDSTTCLPISGQAQPQPPLEIRQSQHHRIKSNYLIHLIKIPNQI